MPEFKTFDYGNVLATGEGIKGQRYRNALMQEEMDSLPMQRQMAQQTYDMRAQDMENDKADRTQQQIANAQGVFGRFASAISQSENPLEAYRWALQDPSFRGAARVMGLRDDQLFISPDDTPEKIRAGTADWARAYGAGVRGDQRRVHSTFVGKNGNQWYLTSDGQPIDTRVPASQFAQRPVEAGGAVLPFDPATGTTGAPIATPEQQLGAAQDLAAAKAEGAAGVVPAETRASLAAKVPRLAAAERRLNRVAEASAALSSGGGPVEGRLRTLIGTPAAQELDAANAQLMTELTALTRTPGIGSQSDLEQRLAQLQLPSASQHPAVRERSIAELDAFLGDLAAAIGGAPAQSQMPTFQTEAQAEAAAAAGQIKPGDRVSVGGVTGVWQ